ncbi:MAG: class I SAM-dependent DNA methyltransferase [Candidatus Nitrosotenuis sp.]
MKLSKPSHQKLTAQDLEKKLHAAADILRKYLNAAENYKLVLPLLFVKRLNDNFIEKAEKLKKEGISEKEAYENRRRHTFFVPKEARFSKLQEAESDVGNKINEVFREIERANPKLEGILVNAEFANTDKYTDDALREIIKIFASLNLADSNLDNEDVFGDAYEYLLEEFAGETKKKGGQFYTPRQVVRLMANLVAPEPGMRICDPTCGSGGMLIQSRKYIEKHFPSEDPTNLTLEGQESNPDTLGICKMNLVVHGITDFNIELGDVLGTPKLLDGGKLRTYHRVLANFPFSEDWNNTNAAKDPYDRFRYGIPPSKDKADFAFIQHMFSCLNEKGRAAIVASQGVLFRGKEEKKIRAKMILGDEKEGIQGDIIEAIVALPPAIFYGTQIPGCVLILNKNKPPERKNKILFYYAAHKDDYLEQPNRNILREEDIDKITSAIRNFKDIDRRCHIADLEEIKENGFNLNVPRYVDISEPEEEVDIQNEIDELKKLETEREEHAVKVSSNLKELGFKV